ncbi:hypothetical protein EG19_01425 [Thermoanaerobaculum aquaticum]|uniref:Chorismate lyase n=1 Tax=Thermoanaerobaculum aquaticum TaxID=1312852 RepID=A0A062Y0Y6_9BACT|nr:hypothetical protein [Thermoanaerobaculum aquaticum]KDA54061.1 hypothetical protein EG19_01425 [Thermoanaerobaculum aquaticum]
MKTMIELSPSRASWPREFSADRPLMDIVASRFGQPPRFQVVSQRFLAVAGTSPTVERLSCYLVSGKPVSLHLVRFHPGALPPWFAGSFLAGERLGALLEGQGWPRQQLAVSFFPEASGLLAHLPWESLGFSAFPAWVRRFWVGEGGQRAVRVWEILPWSLWLPSALGGAQ